MIEYVPTDAARLVLDRFRWVQGHGDVWRLFDEAPVFAAVVDGLVTPWRDRGITKVCGIESRGFLLGGAAALALGVGFAPVRKADGLLPGDKMSEPAERDYRGQRHTLRMQLAALQPADRVVLVDDWAESGNQALAVKRLVERCGATFGGASVIVNQLSPASTAALGEVTQLVYADQLGDSSRGG